MNKCVIGHMGLSTDLRDFTKHLEPLFTKNKFTSLLWKQESINCNFPKILLYLVILPVVTLKRWNTVD